MNRVAEPNPVLLIRLSRDGDVAALGQLLEIYRNYLTVLARIHVGADLQGKVGASDVVQETFLQAHRCFAQFRGSTEEELLQWLRRVQASRLAKLLRRYLGTQQRDVRLEQQLEDDLDQSSCALARAVKGSQSSPSQQVTRREQAVILADALEHLRADYRDVIILHHVEGLSVSEVARRMGQSRYDVEKLWMRALAELRRAIGD